MEVDIMLTNKEKIELLEAELEEARGWWDFDLCERLEQAIHDLREHDGPQEG